MINLTTITVEFDKAEEVEKLLKEPSSDVEKDKVVFEVSHTFNNGYQMCIQLVSDLMPSKNPCWTQAILYDNEGNELTQSEVEDQFFGNWNIEFEDEYYSIIVNSETKPEEFKFTLNQVRHASLCMFPETFEKLWKKYAPDDRKDLDRLYSFDCKKLGFLEFMAEYGHDDEMLEILSKMIKDINKL